MAELTPLQPEKPKRTRSAKEHDDSTLFSVGRFDVTRRQALIGAGVVAAAAAVGGGVALLGGSDDGAANDKDGFDPISAREDDVVDVVDFDELDPVDCCTVEVAYDLPLGCIITANSSTYATVLKPSGNNSTLMSVARLNIMSGYMETTIEKAVSEESDFEIYDARSNEGVIVWVETNFLTGDWHVFTASVNGYIAGEAQLVDQGDKLYDPPSVCVCGDWAVWTVMPDPNGEASNKDSYVKKIRPGDAESTTVYTSPGRLCAPPQSSGNILTITPRVDTGNVYYRLLAIDIDSNEHLDSMVMPKAMACNEVVYEHENFVFCIEQTYDYDDGIGNYGTYLPLGDSRYMRFTRTPVACPAWTGCWLIVKSTQAIVGINAEKRHYFPIGLIEGCATFGDYLATAGEADHIVAYTTVSTTKDGKTTGKTRVRVFGMYDDTAEAQDADAAAESKDAGDKKPDEAVDTGGTRIIGGADDAGGDAAAE